MTVWRASTPNRATSFHSESAALSCTTHVFIESKGSRGRLCQLPESSAFIGVSGPPGQNGRISRAAVEARAFPFSCSAWASGSDPLSHNARRAREDSWADPGPSWQRAFFSGASMVRRSPRFVSEDFTSSLEGLLEVMCVALRRFPFLEASSPSFVSLQSALS